ncbi:MAG: hypothetical protein Q9164_007372 [Protoblastenia rupestris]
MAYYQTPLQLDQDQQRLARGENKVAVTKNLEHVQFTNADLVVRHAQRTHRQRTQNYIKTLESEVVRLRESEGKLLTERDDLRNAIQVLKVTIISANLSLPPGIDDPEPTSLPPPASQFDMPATVSYFQDDLDHQRLHVSWPDPSNQTFSLVDTQRPNGTPLPHHPHQSSVQKPLPDFPNDFSLDTISVVGGQRPAAEKHSHAPPPDVNPFPAVDTIETAIDFVLALEHPCMAHIPYPPDSLGIDPANHMMMVRHFQEFPQHPYLQT